jgi:hypothetical protein
LLAIMWNMSGLIWKLTLSYVMEPRIMLCTSTSLVGHLCRSVTQFIYLSAQWLIFSVHCPGVRGMICMRLENSFVVIISFCCKNILQKVMELGQCKHLDKGHA